VVPWLASVVVIEYEAVDGVPSGLENRHKIDIDYPNDYVTNNMMSNQNKYTFFDAAYGENGFLSVGYNSRIYTDSKTYPNAAGYIMDSANEIVHDDGLDDEMIDVDLLKIEMDCVTARFPSLEDEIDWMEPSKTVCYAANIYKFDQNCGLLGMLLGTNDNTIVFANENNFGAGIGFSIDDAMENESDWGDNMLGEILMKLRGLYRAEMQD
jgi:ribA/ribD-fused uncharacterized protein